MFAKRVVRGTNPVWREDECKGSLCNVQCWWGMQWVDVMQMQEKHEGYKKDNRDPSWWVCNGLSMGMRCNATEWQTRDMPVITDLPNAMDGKI